MNTQDTKAPKLNAKEATPILETIMLLFDGGCQPNPGSKYGSFSIKRKSRSNRIVPVYRKTRIDLGIGRAPGTDQPTMRV